jgi:hypothetical protein
MAWGWPCCNEYGVPVLLTFRGSQELAAVLAAVAVGAGCEASGICSRLSSVRSSFEGVILTSGSSTAESSTGVETSGSRCAG